jgi:hypothetical protein
MKELTFSQYFPKFMGYNNHSDQQSNMYFAEYSKSKCI